MRMRAEIKRTEVLDAATIDGIELKKLVHDENENVFAVNNGCEIRAFNTYRNRGGKVVDVYLHYTIVFKSGKFVSYREKSNGNFCNY